MKTKIVYNAYKTDWGASPQSQQKLYLKPFVDAVLVVPVVAMGDGCLLDIVVVMTDGTNLQQWSSVVHDHGLGEHTSSHPHLTPTSKPIAPALQLIN